MRNMKFYIVDVFAEKKYAGNQLAVFRSGNTLSDTEMQSIARETNFSETTFILSELERNGGFDVRIFTPEKEVPFAGHPTLGTAHILLKEVASNNADRIVLNLRIGPIPVTINKSGDGKTTYWMKQIEPVFGQTLSREIVAPVLGLNPGEIDDHLPIQEVSTGLPHILVPIRSLESLKKARINRELYFNLIADRWAKPILIFSSEPYEHDNDMSVRMFADCFGISEDPATGSGNGCLAGYLVRHRYRGQDKINIRSEQGHEIGRPSLLFLKAEEKNGGINIWVGGKAITVAKGEFV